MPRAQQSARVCSRHAKPCACVCVRVHVCVCMCACVLETDGLPADWDLKWDLAHDGDTKPGRRAFYLEEGEGFKC